MSDSLWPHGLQHSRPPCPSLPPRVCLNLGPMCRWCPPTILILCRPLLLLPLLFPSIRVFSNKSALHIRWPKYGPPLHGLLGEERRLLHWPDCPPQPTNVTTGTQTPSGPSPPPHLPQRHTHLRFFYKQAFTVQNSSHGLLGVPSPPSPVFCWFSTNTPLFQHLQT